MISTVQDIYRASQNRGGIIYKSKEKPISTLALLAKIWTQFLTSS
jgi:hypothetical protein